MDRRDKGFEPTEKLADPNSLIPSVTSDELIDLWINTVFAHGGLQGNSTINRKRFDDLVAAYGLGLCEFAFRMEVQFVILHLISFNSLFVRPALNLWIDGGSKPSFELSSPFGRKLKERTADGAIIIRQASSRFFTQETTERRFRRVLSRSRYRTLSFLLTEFDVTDEGCVILVLQSKTILDMVEDLEVEFKEMAHSAEIRWEDLPNSKAMTSVGHMEDYSVPYEPLFFDSMNRFYATRKGIELLDAQFIHFKNAFLTTN